MPDPTEPRQTTDPRARLVLEVLDEVLRFAGDEDLIEQYAGRLPKRERCTAGDITDQFVWYQLFDRLSFDSWTPEGVRAVVETIVAHAPASSLRELAGGARRERRNLREQLGEYDANAASIYGEDVAERIASAGGRERYLEQLRGPSRRAARRPGRARARKAVR